MDETTKQGMANRVWEEFETIKLMREEFIVCNSDKCHIVRLGRIMQDMYNMYMVLTGKEKDEDDNQKP